MSAKISIDEFFSKNVVLLYLVVAGVVFAPFIVDIYDWGIESWLRMNFFEPVNVMPTRALLPTLAYVLVIVSAFSVLGGLIGTMQDEPRYVELAERPVNLFMSLTPSKQLIGAASVLIGGLILAQPLEYLQNWNYHFPQYLIILVALALGLWAMHKVGTLKTISNKVLGGFVILGAVSGVYFLIDSPKYWYDHLTEIKGVYYEMQREGVSDKYLKMLMGRIDSAAHDGFVIQKWQVEDWSDDLYEAVRLRMLQGQPK